MIVDLDKFIARHKPYWTELDTMLTRIEAEPTWTLDLAQARRLHYLYERASACLASIDTFVADPAVRQYVEQLVARAYGVVHGRARRRKRLRPIKWLTGTFPRTFRKHVSAFGLALAAMLVGAIFGGLALRWDPDSKPVLIGSFGHLAGDPSDRVAEEEAAPERQKGNSAFASMLMTHNTKVSMLALALGLTWGVGTIILLFYNGVILGAIVTDYVAAGEGAFLTGWLLPHGSVEIPAILIGSQAGLVLASALIGRGERDPLKMRLRNVLPSVATLILGVAIILVWAGIIESFISQYHKGVLPYWLKISFGVLQLTGLILFLALAGRNGTDDETPSVDLS